MEALEFNFAKFRTRRDLRLLYEAEIHEGFLLDQHRFAERVSLNPRERPSNFF